MPEWLSRWIPEGWSNTELAVAAGALTIGTAIVSLVAVAMIVVRIPPDYFAGDHPPTLWGDRHPFVRWPALILKNLFGILLIVLGIVMSFPGVPGQGILTVLIGAMLLDFPGKRRAERWLLRRRGVLKAINKLRARSGRLPLQLESSAT